VDIIIHTGESRGVSHPNSWFGHAAIIIGNDAYSKDGEGFHKMSKNKYLYGKDDGSSTIKTEGEMNIRNTKSLILRVPADMAEEINKELSIKAEDKAEDEYDFRNNNCAIIIGKTLLKHNIIPRRPPEKIDGLFGVKEKYDVSILPRTLRQDIRSSKYYIGEQWNRIGEKLLIYRDEK